MEQVNNNVKDIQERLQAPFTADEVGFVIKSKTKNPNKFIVSPFISAHTIQQRLDEVVGIENWQNEYKTWIDKSQLCGISICINGNWITKWDGADCTDFEKIKGGLSSAFKRAAKQWGIGRYLSNSPVLFATCELRGDKPFITDSEKKRLFNQMSSPNMNIDKNKSNKESEPIHSEIDLSQEQPTQNSSETAQSVQIEETVSTAILKQIKKLIAEKGYSESKICNKYGVIQLEHLSAAHGIDCLRKMSIA